MQTAAFPVAERSPLFKDVGPLALTTTNSYAEFVNDGGYSSIAFRLVVPTGGAVIFEGLFDSSWESITMRQVGSDGYTSYSAENGTYLGSVSAARSFRIRVLSQGLGNGTVSGRLQRDAATLEGIENSAPPHKIGYGIVHKDFTFSAAQTDTDIWVPETGKKFVVTDIHFSYSGSNSAIITFFDQTNQPGSRVVQLQASPQSSAQFIPIRFGVPFVSSSVNNHLKITTDAAVTIYGVVHGYEIYP